jgi:type IV pilus assembly protein PilB
MESLKERVIKHILAYKDVPVEVIKELDKSSPDFAALKENLIKRKIVSDDEIYWILSREYKIPYLDLDRFKVSAENKKLLSKDLAFRYKVLPISKVGEVLTLATSNPTDVLSLDELLMSTSFKKIDLVLAKEDKIIKSLNIVYLDGESVKFAAEVETADDGSVKEVSLRESQGLETLIKESKLPPIVRIVDMIVYEGLKGRASDIHIEPTEKDLVVRYRVDGVLHHGLTLPKRNQSAIIARLKIMSSLNITEFRVPQDGRFKVKFEKREIDFRVSSLPTHFGEKIVLRILDRESLSLGLQKLGFSEVPMKLFQEALALPFGMILVTGPTGSGKSTTLYSIINQINTPDKNIVTIEDPVEYQLEGITQIQIRADINLNFSSALRSVLRQSPDVIMVGEIRDAETADIAIKASLTGEFILSTLHTNNSVGAITRLIDMGVEPFLVASSFLASTAQRLVRKLCTSCKVKEKTDKKLLERLGLPSDIEELYIPKGCSNCGNTGYRGRIALLEILSFDDTIRGMIVKRATEDDITAYAREKRQFRSLKEDGFEKCVLGHTSLEEVLRVAG